MAGAAREPWQPGAGVLTQPGSSRAGFLQEAMLLESEEVAVSQETQGKREQQRQRHRGGKIAWEGRLRETYKALQCPGEYRKAWLLVKGH